MKNITYIHAGAGSGKTYRLTQELNKCLFTKGIRPSQAILTTFTKLAATEFKEKARQNILSADAPQTERLRMAMELESSSIGTVHSIALNFIRKYWYKLPYGPEPNVMSEDNQKFYLHTSISDIVTDEDIRVLEDFRGTFGMKQENDEITSWQNDLETIISKMNYYEIFDLQESIGNSIRYIETVYNGPEWNTKAQKLADQLVNEYHTFYLNQKASKKRDEMLDYCKKFPYLPDTYTKLQSLCNCMTKAPKKFTERLPTDMALLYEELPSYLVSSTFRQPIIRYTQQIFDIAARWNASYDAFKKINRIITHNDMEQIFLGMLRTDEEVRNDIRSRYRLLMVDEFQDSNPLQIKIFNELSQLIADAGGESIWVGDPKQAIYGFRGADTELVNSIATYFQQAGPDSGLCMDSLKESWRSRKPLVELVNKVFLKAFPEEEIKNRSLIPLRPHFGDDLPHPAVHHWHIQESNKENYYKGMAQQIKYLLEAKWPVKTKDRNAGTHPVHPGDIAILTFSNENCNRIAQALQNEGIPVSYSSKDLLQWKEVRLVISILTSFIDRHNKSVLAELHYLLNNCSTETILNDRLDYLAGIGGNEPDKWLENEPWVSRLEQIRQKYIHSSITDMVTGVILEMDLHDRVAQWGETDIRLQNLSTIQSLAVTYDEYCFQMGVGASVRGFLQHLTTAHIESVMDNSADTVKVLTYHKSKGLEWPVIILDDLHKDKMGDTKNIIKKLVMGVQECHIPQLDGEEYLFNRKYYIQYFPNTLTISANPVQILEDNIVNTGYYWWLWGKDKSEKRRLLYVGMTRARDYLITASYASKNPCMNWLEYSDVSDGMFSIEGTQTDIWKTDDPDHLSSLTTMVTHESLAPAESDTYQYWVKPVTTTKRERKYLSPSELNEPSVEISGTPFTFWDESIGRMKISGVKDMAQIGNCIHQFMAVYKPNEPDVNYRKAESLIRSYQLEKEFNDSANDLINAADFLYRTLTNRYGTPLSVRREQPFYYRKDGQHFHGEMDLVYHCVINGKETCILVDYKSFPGKQTDIEEHCKQYLPQMGIYREALQADGYEVSAVLIYLPVQGKIIEVNTTAH